jgi:hypothetical protein
VDDPKVRQPDILRAKKILGWEPNVQFEEGIKETIEYFRNALKAAGSNCKQSYRERPMLSHLRRHLSGVGKWRKRGQISAH